MAHYQATAVDAWAIAREVAKHHIVGDWKQVLAEAVEAAIRPDAAAVFLCTLGNMLQATYGMAPRAHAHIAERLVGEFLPRVHRAGLDTPWHLFSGEPDVDELALTLPIITELLAPAGYAGMLGAFLRSNDGMIAGWITVFTHAAGGTRHPKILPQLTAVARVAERTVRSSIGIASAVGARFPKISPDPLSERELEIARMAALGYSDLNIAKRLAITEGTVGRHLHNIYRKLGVTSRLELMDLLCTN